MPSLYDSERLAAGYAFDRPPVHQQILKSVHLRRPVGRALDVGCGAGVSTAALAPLALVGSTSNPAMYAQEWLAQVPFTFRVEGGQELRAAVATLAARFTAALADNP